MGEKEKSRPNFQWVKTCGLRRVTRKGIKKKMANERGCRIKKKFKVFI